MATYPIWKQVKVLEEKVARLDKKIEEMLEKKARYEEKLEDLRRKWDGKLSVKSLAKTKENLLKKLQELDALIQEQQEERGEGETEETVEWTETEVET